MNVTDPETETNPSITLISAAWQDTLSKSNLDWFNHRGYLTYDLDEKLVVLTLNTVPYSVRRFANKLVELFNATNLVNFCLAESFPGHDEHLGPFRPVRMAQRNAARAPQYRQVCVCRGPHPSHH
jgi:hypothetical protein